MIRILQTHDISNLLERTSQVLSPFLLLCPLFIEYSFPCCSHSRFCLGQVKFLPATDDFRTRPLLMPQINLSRSSPSRIFPDDRLGFGEGEGSVSCQLSSPKQLCIPPGEVAPGSRQDTKHCRSTSLRPASAPGLAYDAGVKPCLGCTQITRDIFK